MQTPSVGTAIGSHSFFALLNVVHYCLRRVGWHGQCCWLVNMEVQSSHCVRCPGKCLRHCISIEIKLLEMYRVEQFSFVLPSSCYQSMLRGKKNIGNLGFKIPSSISATHSLSTIAEAIFKRINGKKKFNGKENSKNGSLHQLATLTLEMPLIRTSTIMCSTTILMAISSLKGTC